MQNQLYQYFGILFSNRKCGIVKNDAPTSLRITTDQRVSCL